MNQQIKYIIYARKSSESDEKQVQSIEDQLQMMKEVSKTMGLKLIDTLTEARSAKEPHDRPVFEKMIERIEAGEANGILVWKIDRLSRNPIDSARIQWLLQKETIKSIRTPWQEYRPEDNTIILSVESSNANQYIRDLSKNVKRGLKSKIEKGWMPGTAPLGYLNTKTEIRGENYITKDPDRFSLIRKAWDLMLTGNYVPTQILEKLNHQWGFRTRPSKKRGLRPMARSTLYHIFTNPFYAGIISYNNSFTAGKHPPMVTVEEFDKIQTILGRKGKPRPNRYFYPYNGLIACGECGGYISATYKEKIIKKDGHLKSYTLYYCPGARRNANKCSQRHYTNAEIIDNQISAEIEKFTILPEFKDWALKVLATQNDAEIEARSRVYLSQQNALNEAQKQLDNLTQIRIKDLIDDEEYLREKTRIKSEIAKIQTAMKNTEERSDSWLTLTEKTFEFACRAREAFRKGDPETKKAILSAIGLNWTLKDHKLSIEAVEWLTPLKVQYPALEAEYKAFEPALHGPTERQKEAFASLSPNLRGRPDLNRQPPA